MKSFTRVICLASFTAIFLMTAVVHADVITLTLDNVDEQIACEEVWHEQGIAMSFVPAAANECDPGGCNFGISTGEVWLFGVCLAVDLSGIQGIATIEIDITDGCPHPNCENAYLLNGAIIIDEDHDNNPMIVTTGGLEVDLLRVNGCEDAITEIRIIGDTLVTSEVLTWGRLKSLY